MQKRTKLILILVLLLIVLLVGQSVNADHICDKEEKKRLKALAEKVELPFYIMKTEKGFGGPTRHQEAHQIPLKNPATDEEELKELEEWLKSYNFAELFQEVQHD